MITKTRTTLVLLLALAASAAGCGGDPVDLKASLTVDDLVTGWFDAGIVAGKNKLVPGISFRLKNVSARPLASVQAMVIFRPVNEPDQEWGSSYAVAIDAKGLPAGETTAPLVLHSSFGHTGEQPRLEMLQNRYFVDAKIELYAKYRAQNWVKLGEWQASRQLLTR
jgi:hypothetical protein